MQTTSADRHESSSPRSAALPKQEHSRIRSNSGKQAGPPSGSSLLGSNGYQEQTIETSIGIQLWYPNQLLASTSALSKAPILRDVPQVKRKLTRKDRDSNVIVTETRSFQSLKSAAPSWLREKPSRQRLATTFKATHHSRGSWKRATAICRDNGVLHIYGEERALVHSILVKDLSSSDIRIVDDSLFSFPNVLGIFSRPSALHLGTRSPRLGGDMSASKVEPIYLCFPTNRKMKKWRALLRTFAKPEIYGSPQRGGTHRCYRQIEMKILEAKFSADRQMSVSRSNGLFNTSLDEDDYSGALAASISAGNAANLSDRQGSEEPFNSPTKREAQPGSSESISNLCIETEVVETSHQTNKDTQEDDDSDAAITSGPISGLSGRDRILESSPMTSAASSYEMERKASDGPSSTNTLACYCLVWMAGDLVAKTKMCNSSFNAMTWFDKFSLKDLPSLSSIQIDVMQSSRNGKSGLLGTVNLPLETMRRGETMEGWFPIWTTRSRDSETLPSPFIEGFYADEMMGEIKLSISVAEETILPLRKYALVEEELFSSHAQDLVATLCKRLEEDQVISHLVDIYTSKGIIVERLNELTKAESSTFGENPALLFRSNTVLTRAVDKYQRLYCKDWLDACIGSTVRRICQDQIWLESNDSQHYYAVPLQVQETSTSVPTTIIVESNLDALQRLCKDLWTNIYANRHRCPRDLRSVLCNIRTKVNSCYDQSNTSVGPGIQGVGAFVFLRLICPAITTPNLYGLMGTSPSVASSKTLMLVAKMFLALANKKMAFDKDKEPWLGQANDFLTLQATAYDDFITHISTEPPSQEVIKESLGDEADYGFQKMIKSMSKNFSVLHRESIPSREYLLDRPLALAELVSFVVREASVEVVSDRRVQNGEISKESKLDQYYRFVDLCCDVEGKVGYLLDRAGFDAEPIDFSKINGVDGLGLQSALVYTNLNRSTASPQSVSLSHLEPSTSIRARRATVSGGRVPSGGHNADHTPTKSSIGEDSISYRRLPMRFAPHLLSSEIGRLSLDSSETGRQESLGRLRDAQSSSSKHESNIEESLRKLTMVGDTDTTITPGQPSSGRKTKLSWWKKL